jgi:hypothetical protein
MITFALVLRHEQQNYRSRIVALSERFFQLFPMIVKYLQNFGEHISAGWLCKNQLRKKAQ